MSPMIKISDKMKPEVGSKLNDFTLLQLYTFHLMFLIYSIIFLVSKIVVRFLNYPGFPYAAMVPAPDLIDKCFKKKEMSIEAGEIPFLIKAPRLQSAVALMRCTDQIAAHMEVDICLILHGGRVVTSPTMSQGIRDVGSIDKTLKIYPTCWHNLLIGEPRKFLRIYLM